MYQATYLAAEAAVKQLKTKTLTPQVKYDNTIKLWDLTSGTCLKTLMAHVASVNLLALLPNGQLASGSADHTIKLWDLELKATLEELEQKAPECKMM